MSALDLSFLGARWSPPLLATLTAWVSGSLARWAGFRPIFVVYRDKGEAYSLGAGLDIAMHRCATELLEAGRSHFRDTRNLRTWVQSQLAQATWSVHWVRPDLEGLREVTRALGCEENPDALQHCAEMLGLPHPRMVSWPPKPFDEEETQIMGVARRHRPSDGCDLADFLVDATDPDAFADGDTEVGE